MWIGLLIGLVIAIVTIAFWHQFIKIRSLADEIHFINTGDGQKIAIYHYKSRNQSLRLPPLILCHGLMANHYNFDFGNQPGNLARFLCREGYDVWVPELRGRRFTRPKPFSPGKYNWSFAHYARYDAPDTIDFVLRTTKEKKVIWLGHSMGGMLGYTLAVSNYQKKIASMIVISAPSNFLALKRWKIISKLFIKFYPLSVIPSGMFSKIFAPLLSIYRSERFSLIANAANFTYFEKFVLLSNVISNISTYVLKEFAEAVVSGNFKTYDDRINLKRDMHKIKLPILFITGGADELVPELSVRWGFENVSSKKKEWVVASKKGGFAINFGHGDLMVSRSAYMHIYPVIHNFIIKNTKKKGFF